MTDFYAATRKGLFGLAFDRSHALCVSSTHFLGEPVTQVMCDPRDGAIYAALRLGHFGPKLHRSDDGGKSFAEIAAPAFPKSEDDKAPGVDTLWALAAGGEDAPGRLYCGTIPAGFFVSDDRGASWRHLAALDRVPGREKWFGGGYDHPGIHSLVVDQKDSAHVLIGVSCGGVWETHDVGQSWALRTNGLFASYMPPEQADDGATQDPHAIAACAAEPGHLWMQHHNGMFHSGDGAKTWRHLKDVPVSDFGFLVLAHPRDPKTAWFVPAVSDEKRYAVDGALCVTKTVDGAQHFSVKRTGLPQAHAYDLFYRHGGAVDATGTRLVIGSTTGGIFSSADGGETWRELPARLPPVYAMAYGGGR